MENFNRDDILYIVEKGLEKQYLWKYKNNYTYSYKYTNNYTYYLYSNISKDTFESNYENSIKVREKL